jgi:hypothetical protein
VADENKDGRAWLVCWHPGEPAHGGLHMITPHLGQRLRLANTREASHQRRQAAEDLVELYQHARLQILETLFCNMFQITKVEHEYVTVAVVDLIPPIWQWPAGAEGNATPGITRSGASVAGTEPISEEDLEAVSEAALSQMGTSEAMAWDEEKWKSHCSSMSQKARALENLLEKPLPESSVSPQPRTTLQR